MDVPDLTHDPAEGRAESVRLQSDKKKSSFLLFRMKSDLPPSGCGAAASAARGEHRSSVTPSAPVRSVHKLSALMTSPPDLVLMAHQVCWLTLSFTNRTE